MQGNQEERDNAYHQGTVWPWLYGPFCEGWLRVYGNQGVQKVKKLIFGLEAVMSEHGISTISEIHDGDPPHSPQGAISQAWSVGEVLRIIELLGNKVCKSITEAGYACVNVWMGISASYLRRIGYSQLWSYKRNGNT